MNEGLSSIFEIMNTVLAPAAESKFAKYRDDPIGYARDVLRVKYLSAMQEELLRLCAKPHDEDWKGKLAIGTGVNYGKSFFLSIIANWCYDCRGPCIVVTTAPTQASVVELLWKEIRIHRGNADMKWGIGSQDFIGPAAPEMRRSPDWYAKGYVATKAERFKGRHGDRIYFLYDESVGLGDFYFQTTKTMFKSDADMLWVCAYNPTDTTCPMYHETSHPESDWDVVELSTLEHPNILAQLRGEPRPIPAAVSLEQLEDGIKDDCDPIEAADVTITDFEWPPGSGKWWRPGPRFEGHFLGRWPTNDESAIWSDGLWKAISKPLTWSEVKILADEIPRIGCDVARFGDDSSSIHVVWGDYAVHHESKNGQNTMRTVGRLVELTEEWATKCNAARAKAELQPISAKNIPINVDDVGVGSGVTDRLREQGCRVYPVNAQSMPSKPNRYRDVRSELWFATRDRAREGRIKLGLLPTRILEELRKEAKAPLYSLNSSGQREVEEKRFTKTRLGHSPDNLDAMNLAWFKTDFRAPEILHIETPTFQQRMEDNRQERKISWFGKRQGRRGLFGR